MQRLILTGLVLGLIFQSAMAEEGAATIHTNFPGGNAKVIKNVESTIQIEPDLRGDNPWFYWSLKATATKPGRVTFVFPEKVIGFKNGAIGNQGPAISRDQGKTWNWMGKSQVKENTFFLDFKKTGETVCLAVTIPYLQSDWQAFVKRHAKNPHLQTRVLTKSKNGREVELLQIGKPGPNIKPILFTARHHATETMASYLLEGFLEEALSESPEAKEFRSRFVLYTVPFVDKDGVEEGDQGKNRKPHDHNRDYGEKSIYPEVQAIKKLHAEVKFRFAIDFHCPTLVMPDHQVMYFVGAKQHPPYNTENIAEFCKWVKKGLPKTAPAGPLNWLKEESKFSPKSSRYFAFQEGVILSATLEFPFAPPGKKTDPASCRNYGKTLLQAWINTRFLTPDLK